MVGQQHETTGASYSKLVFAIVRDDWLPVLDRGSIAAVAAIVSTFGGTFLFSVEAAAAA